MIWKFLMECHPCCCAALYNGNMKQNFCICSAHGPVCGGGTCAKSAFELILHTFWGPNGFRWQKTKGLSKSKIQVLLFYIVVVWFLSHKGLVFGTLLTSLVLGRLFAKDQDVYIDPKMFAKVGQEVGRFLLPADVTAQELQALIHETWRSSGTNEVETGKHG